MLSGSITKQIVSTDSKGQIRVNLDPGDYSIRVMTGCNDALQILNGTAGRAGVALGLTTTAKLSVSWHHRRAPAPPVFSSVTPYWPIGEEVDVRFDVVDRCADLQRVPRASFSTHVLEVNENLRFTRPVNRVADDSGYGYAHVACIREGQTHLLSKAPDDPSDTIDLLDYDSSSGFRSSCKNVE